MVPALEASTSSLTPRNVARFSDATKATLARQYRELVATLALDGGVPGLAEQLTNGINVGAQAYPSRAIEEQIDALALTWGRIGAQYQISTRHEQKALDRLKDAVNLQTAYQTIGRSQPSRS